MWLMNTNGHNKQDLDYPSWEPESCLLHIQICHETNRYASGIWTHVLI